MTTITRLAWNFTDGIVARKEFCPTKISFVELMKRRIERRIRALWP
jgi:hypothetical protein